MIWGGVFYWLADKKTKNIIERFVWFASISAMINYMVFNYSFGVLNTTLHYENRVSFNGMQRSINLIVLIVLAIVLNVIWRKYKKNINEILLVGIIAMFGMTMINIFVYEHEKSARLRHFFNMAQEQGFN